MSCNPPGHVRAVRWALLLLLGACGATGPTAVGTDLPDADANSVSNDAPFEASPPADAASSDAALAPDAFSGEDAGTDLGSPEGRAMTADATSLPLCGTTPCDPHASTCCVPVDGGAASYECRPTTTATCPAGFGAFHCLQQSDCEGSGLVCCGSYSLANGTAETQCSSGPCAIAQLCKTDAECQNHQRCTVQTCPGQAVLQLCGVQTALGCVP